MKPKLLFLLLLLLCLPAPSFAAITAASQWEVRTTGGDSNAGVFDSTITNAGTDYSQQDTAQLTLSDVVTNSTTTVTSATGGFTAATIGNGINIAGTVYQITAVASTNSLTVDRATGTGTGQTGKVGGALGSPGYALGQIVGQNTIWLKGGTYNVSTNTNNVSGGYVTISQTGTPAVQTRLIGYSALRGDAPTGSGRPTISNTISAISMLLSVTTQNASVQNIIFTTTGQYGCICGGNSGNSFIYCDVSGATSSGFANNCACFACRTVSCGTGFNTFNNMVPLCYCVADTCGTGFSAANMLSCLALRCTVKGFSALVASAVEGQRIISCTAYNNAGNGFSLAGSGAVVVNCVAVQSGGYGFSADGAVSLISCAAYSNTSGNLTGTPALNQRPITLTATPFTNAAGGDFTLNSAAGGGALLRGAGYSTLPGLTPTGYPDIGAYQHLDGGGTKRKVQ